MHDLPRHKLSELLSRHGHALCNDSKRLEGLLKDVLRNEYKREAFVLISALREGIAEELRSSASTLPAELLVAKLARKLQNNLGLNDSAALWGVESWALALNVPIRLETHPVCWRDNVIKAARNCFLKLHDRVVHSLSLRHSLTLLTVTGILIAMLAFSPPWLTKSRIPRKPSATAEVATPRVDSNEPQSPFVGPAETSSRASNPDPEVVAPTVLQQRDTNQSEDVRKPPEKSGKPIPSKESLELAQKWRRQGREKFERGDYRGAAEQFSLALAIDESEETFGDRAVAHLFLGEYAYAVEDSTRVIETNSKNAAAFYLRGLSYTRLRKFSEASKDLLQATEIDPMISRKRASWQSR